MDNEQIPTTQSKKRTLHVMPQDFLGQFSSKADMLSYMREQL